MYFDTGSVSRETGVRQAVEPGTFTLWADGALAPSPSVRTQADLTRRRVPPRKPVQ
ncbi:hypothetical protein [Streptomyces sp. NPDC092370]|uniref:hypothetical protein n=1 Tax=Streptomyces sp. NPDC092370 TaxID=3366016 RepID=UPI0038079F0E